jgi:hypothetical protein
MFNTSSNDVNGSSKTFLKELQENPSGVQARNMKFVGSSDQNRLRTVRFLTHEGYIKELDIDGYMGYQITERGKSFLAWANIHC